MLRLLIILILFPVLSNAQEWKSFSDTSILFTAKYPANWINKIKEGKRVFFTSPDESEKDDFYENVNINVTFNSDYGVKYKIADMFPAVTETLKPSFTDFKSERQENFKWNNSDAVEIVFSGYNKKSENLSVRIIQWFCFYKGRLYTATFTSKADNDTYTSTARKIMNSIVFID